MNLFECVNKDDVVIDCGAYVGRMSHYFADKGAKVYSFEPSAVLCDMLRERFVNYSKVCVMQKGVYDRNCKRKLYYHTDYINADEIHKIKYHESSSIYSKKINVGKQYFKADVIDLSKFIVGLNCDVKLLKLNIEGAEYKVLNQLIDTGVIYKIENIVVAFHFRSIKSLEKEHLALKKRAIRAGVYETIIQWKWWYKHRSFLNKIRKDYVSYG